MHSSRQSSCYIIGTTSIVTSSQETSWFKLKTLSSSSISAWQNFFAIPQLICTSQTPQIIQSSVLFRSHPSMASKDMPNHVATTWSLPIPSFIQQVATCLGRPFPPTVIGRRSSRRSCQSQQKSYAKACLRPSVNSSVYVHSLGFDKKPDYQHLHSILLQCLAAETDHLDKALLSFAHSPVCADHTHAFSDQV
jgi:hypothetical protein